VGVEHAVTQAKQENCTAERTDGDYDQGDDEDDFEQWAIDP